MTSAFLLGLAAALLLIMFGLLLPDPDPDQRR